uniref:Uncharacterized protein n=1 Tax=Terrapene triunguis TaxID=2587831 RepID=A0A674J476_9SAUR
MQLLGVVMGHSLEEPFKLFITNNLYRCFGPLLLSVNEEAVLGLLPRVPLAFPSCSPHPAPAPFCLSSSPTTLPQHGCCCSASSSLGCFSGPSGWHSSAPQLSSGPCVLLSSAPL